jgi:hypothetical protein
MPERVETESSTAQMGWVATRTVVAISVVTAGLNAGWSEPEPSEVFENLSMMGRRGGDHPRWTGWSPENSVLFDIGEWSVIISHTRGQSPQIVPTLLGTSAGEAYTEKSASSTPSDDGFCQSSPVTTDRVNPPKSIGEILDRVEKRC